MVGNCTASPCPPHLPAYRTPPALRRNDECTVAFRAPIYIFPVLCDALANATLGNRVQAPIVDFAWVGRALGRARQPSFFNLAVIACAMPMRSFTGVGIMIEVLDLAWDAVIVPPQISPLVTGPRAKTTPIITCVRAPLMHNNDVCTHAALIMNKCLWYVRFRAGRAWRRPPRLGRPLALELYMTVRFLASRAWPRNGSPRHAEWRIDTTVRRVQT